MLIAKGQRAAPSGFAITIKPKQAVLSWSVYTDPAHVEMVVKRYTSSGNASADTSGAEVGRTKGTQLTDATALTAGTAYWWRAYSIDANGNASALASAVTATWSLVVAADTDATVLSAPGSIALTQSNQDVDADGMVDIALAATWGAVTGATEYEIEVSRATATNGTYVVVDHLKSTGLVKAFKALTIYFYRIRVRAMSFNGTPGAWSTAYPSTTTGVNPVKKSGSASAAAGLSPLVGINIITLDWTENTDADYSHTEIWRSQTANSVGSAVKIGSVKGRTYIDSLPSNTTNYYWVRHVNTSGNPGSYSSNWPVNSVPTHVDTADLNNGSVTTSKLAANAVTTAKLDASAVTTSTRDRTDTNITVSTSYVIIGSITFDITDLKVALFGIRFQTATAGLFDIQVRQNTTEVFSVLGVQIAADNMCSFEERIVAASLPNSNTTFELRVRRSAGSAFVYNRCLTAFNIKA